MSTEEVVTRYKFLRAGLKSNATDHSWHIGEWQHEDGEIKVDHHGFHCSAGAYHAFAHTLGEILAIVEAKGAADIRDDHEAYSDMRIIKAYKWQKSDSVALAVYAAEQVLPIYEEANPDDQSPREALEAAKSYLADPANEELRLAAGEAAETAEMVEAEEDAAINAAEAAASAAIAAYVEEAAEAADNAVRTVDTAEEAFALAAEEGEDEDEEGEDEEVDEVVLVGSATARQEFIRKINAWMESHITELDEYQ